jgi:hypothetical protein
VVIQNRGRKAATNVRLGHHHLPAFSVYPPSLAFSEVPVPGSANQILFLVLPPKSQVQITYVYFPPLTYNQIHAGISSDDGSPTARDLLITHRPATAVIIAWWSLVALGLVTALYGLFLLSQRVFS